MLYEKFIDSLQNEGPPEGVKDVLTALWWDGKSNWDEAHRIAQEITDLNGSWVHAYLHRKEGDIWNADYWYTRAGKKRPEKALDEEWKELVNYFCRA